MTVIKYFQNVLEFLINIKLRSSISNLRAYLLYKVTSHKKVYVYIRKDYVTAQKKKINSLQDAMVCIAGVIFHHLRTINTLI